MKKLLEGEKGQRNIKVSASNTDDVFVTHCWRADARSQRYELCFQYSFKGMSPKEIQRLAVLWANKDFQNRMRSENFTEKELEEQEKRVISVKEMYERERKEKDPVKSADSALSKLSDAERKALIEKYLSEK